MQPEQIYLEDNNQYVFVFGSEENLNRISIFKLGDNGYLGKMGFNGATDIKPFKVIDFFSTEEVEKYMQKVRETKTIPAD